MKHREVLKVIGAGFAALCVFLSGGCGGKSAANVITVSVTPSTTLILGQSVNLTATVGGATNTDVTWSPCQFVFDVTTNGKTTTQKPQDCPKDGSYGVLSNQQTTGTATYTAPDPAKFQLPDQTKFPNFRIVITATSVQDTKRSGMATIALISGIKGVLTPLTASVPTTETQRFFVTLTNDIQNKGVTWLITQNVPNTDSSGKFLNYPQLPTCTVPGNKTGCGSITPDANNPNVAVYTAPDTIPTAITPTQKNNPNSSSPQNLTIVATPNADNAAFLIGTITITPSGPITFRTISPTIAPQGAALWDIYLDAPNISSASIINLTYGNSPQPVVKNSDSGQIKILFPVPAASTSTTTTTTTCTDTKPCSTGARLRLNASDLATAGPVTVSVTDPNPNVTVTQCTGSPLPTGCSSAGVFTFNIVPVRPTSTATVPDDVVLGSQALGLGVPVIIDGGYFGPFDPNGLTQNNVVRAFFQAPGNALLIDQTRSNSRRLVTSISPNNINPSAPGLYPLYVAQATSQPPASPSNPSVTNLALFPDYSTTPPVVVVGPTGITAGTNPSAVDIDPDLGVLVVAETGSNTIEFFSISRTAPYLTSLGTVASTGSAPINVPTGVSVNRANHTVAVVNFGAQTPATSTPPCQPMGQSVTVLNIPGNPSPITPFSVDLTPTIQGALCPAPMPYSIGVDPDSNFALVAYSTSSVNPVSSAANLGYIVNLNPNVAGSTSGQTSPCALGQALKSSSNQFGECLFAQVTLNSGTYPQVAMAPHGHSALVTPGGSGAVRGVDITKPSTANFIQSADLSAGVVTVIVDTMHCPPGVPATGPSTNPCPLTIVPGNAGSVLITGLNPKTDANRAFFNGVFAVNVTSNNSFTYVVPNASVTDSCQPPPNSQTTSCGGEVFYGKPDQIFGLPATTQGVAINPITSTAAIADANATGTNGPQIDLLSGLDQSLSSITFFAGCTAFNSSTCSSAPELLATTNVAWQPFTNELVSYNPKLGFVSVSDPVGRSRYAIVTDPAQGHLGPSAAPFCVSNGKTNGTLTLWGGIAVDPATNLAFVVESGQIGTSTNPCQVTAPGQIEVISLAASSAIKPTHISQVIVPSPASSQGTIGGIPNALVPQAALTCTTPTPPATTCDLPGVKIFGSGFTAGMQVRLDNVDITTLPGGAVGPPLNGGREVDVTIPHSLLARPHHYALDVLSSSAQSNAVDFLVVQAVDLSNVCVSSTNNAPVNTMPSSVAIADQIASGPFSPIGLVSVTGCNSIVEIDLNPASATFGQILGNPISVGTNPQGIAIWQRQGLAVVANNGSGTASVIDLTKSPPASPLTADVTTGTNPTGVAINEATGAALVTNFASNTVSLINLGLLFPQPNASSTTPPTTLTAATIGGIQMPIAVAIDPDRGVNNQGIAVVTAVSLSSAFGPTGSLAVVEIGQATPALSPTSSGFVPTTPTGIVFDPTVVNSATTNQGAFFANSSGTNSITEFVPEGGGGSVSVGINPTSLAINPQTGAIFTSNSASNTISIVDTISGPFKTHQTLGIPGSPTFGVAVDQFTNLAVIVDQANMRVLLFPMPN